MKIEYFRQKNAEKMIKKEAIVAIYIIKLKMEIIIQMVIILIIITIIKLISAFIIIKTE